jgi:hypothetical protein
MTKIELDIKLEDKFNDYDILDYLENVSDSLSFEGDQGLLKNALNRLITDITGRA